MIEAYAGFSPEADKALNYKGPGGQANDTKLGGPWASKRNMTTDVMIDVSQLINL